MRAMAPRFRPPYVLLGALSALVLLLVLAPDAHGAQRIAQTTAAASLLKSAAVVGPLGISPFFALAGFGLAGQLGIWTMPQGLDAFAHPAVWLGLILLGAILQFGRSTKLTKPFAEALGTGESLFAVIATGAVMLPHFANPTPVAQAGVPAGVLLLVAGLSAVTAMVVVRTALDIIIWLSPFPFVDGLFQMAKLILTLGLVMLAVLFPVAAIVVNLIILAIAVLVAKWAVRTARFGATIGYDLTFGRFKAATAMPRDPAVETDLGPFTAFVLEAPGVPKRTAARMHMDAGRWFLTRASFFGPQTKSVFGDDHELRLTPCFLGLEMSGPAGRVLLVPRYKPLASRLLQETRLKSGDKPSLLAAHSMRAARAQASAF